MRMRPMEERKPLNAVVCKRSTRPDNVFYRPYGAQILHTCKRAVVMYSQYTAWLLACCLAPPRRRRRHSTFPPLSLIMALDDCTLALALRRVRSNGNYCTFSSVT